MKRKRVVYLDHTAKCSGGEIALFRTLAALDISKFDPFAILGEDGIFRDRLQSIGIDTHIICLPAAIRDIKKDMISGSINRDKNAIKSYLKYAIQLSKRIRSLNIDIIHCNSLKSDIYGLVSGKLIHVPVIWHIRDHIDSSYLPRRVAKIFQNLASVWPSAVITNSQSTLDRLFPTGRKNRISRVVYDGLTHAELQSIVPVSRLQWLSVPKIGMVGRIAPWKGQHIFLEAAKILTGLGIEAEYEVIGSPLFGETEYESEIMRLATASGSRVRFMGFCNDVPAALRNLNILAHCSIIPEPFGQVIIEGMAEGLPVVASDGGGVREIISSERFGLRTPMGDSQALANALKSLLVNPEWASQLGWAAHAHVRENFTAERSARGIESIYQRLSKVN